MAESSSAKQRHGGRKRLVSSGNRFAFFAAGVVCVLMGIRNTRLLDPSVKGRLTASSSLTTDVRKTNDNNATTTVTTTPRDSTTVTSSAMAPKADDDDDGGGCNCSEPTRWTAQAGQDRYVWHRVLRPQRLCCQGVFVEFGARNGVEHSNTYALERFQGWKGLLAEVDEREIPGLQRNRPRASVIHGPLCPRTQENVTIVLSKLGGWTGSANGYEPTRLNQAAKKQTYPCHYLVDELRKRGWNRVDYMTIDTEGSELALVQDFPWDEFDIRIVQIEQLDERRYTAQRGRKDKIIRHLTNHGYKLLSVYAVAAYDTDDLIFTRNVDAFLNGTRPDRSRDGDHAAATRPVSRYVRRLDARDRQSLKRLRERPLSRVDIMQLRKQQAIEGLKERRRKQEGN